MEAEERLGLDEGDGACVREKDENVIFLLFFIFSHLTGITLGPDMLNEKFQCYPSTIYERLHDI